MLFEPLSWLKLASSWLKMALWSLELAQDGLKLAQVGSKLGPSWLQVGSIGPKIGSGKLLEALLKGPGRVQGGSWGGTWSQEALLEPPEVPKWLPKGPKAIQNDPEIHSQNNLDHLSDPTTGPDHGPQHLT